MASLSPEELARYRNVLSEWLVRCRVALSAYNEATTRAVAAERRLGVPATILSALVATSVFSSLENDASLRFLTGALAIAATVLAALQTFLRHEERAEQFREAARSYGTLRRRIERARDFPPPTEDEALALMKELEEALSGAAVGKPNVPQSIWDRAELKVKGRCDARGFRALRLRLRDRFDFGMAGRRPVKLEEDHDLYFKGLDEARIVAIDELRLSKAASAQPRSVEVARIRMTEAAAGRRGRRAPLDVVEEGPGGFLILDGNATFAVAQQAGWQTIPVRVGKS